MRPTYHHSPPTQAPPIVDGTHPVSRVLFPLPNLAEDASDETYTAAELVIAQCVLTAEHSAGQHAGLLYRVDCWSCQYGRQAADLRGRMH